MESTLVIMFQHGLNHVAVACGLYDIEKRMLSPVGVLKGESGVIGKIFGSMDILVQPLVLSVNIHVYRGIDKGGTWMCRN
ncbi:MAG: hypothetical protein U0T82_11475 [Bacteroidales bacterium]